MSPAPQQPPSLFASDSFADEITSPEPEDSLQPLISFDDETGVQVEEMEMEEDEMMGESLNVGGEELVEVEEDALAGVNVRAALASIMEQSERERGRVLGDPMDAELEVDELEENEEKEGGESGETFVRLPFCSFFRAKEQLADHCVFCFQQSQQEQQTSSASTTPRKNKTTATRRRTNQKSSTPALPPLSTFLPPPTTKTSFPCQHHSRNHLLAVGRLLLIRLRSNRINRRSLFPSSLPLRGSFLESSKLVFGTRTSSLPSSVVLELVRRGRERRRRRR